MRGLLASPLGLLIGLSLGALGGGGSILAVPALVYGAGESVHTATSTSLLVVGIAALMGIGSHWQAGHVRFAQGAAFGIAGIGGSAIGTALNQGTDPDVLLLAFSGIMVVAAAGMWRRTDQPTRPEPVEGETPAGATGGTATMLDVRQTTDVRLDQGRILKILAAGSVVGAITGFFGVGGGFVIVPALVLSLGFAMPEAVGTSLLVIAINSAMALALRAGDTAIDWDDAIPFLVLAVIGTLIGRRFADRLSPCTLTKGFVALLVVVAAFTAVSSTLALT